MAKEASQARRMAFGLPIINGRIACVVIESHSRYKLGRRHGFTPAQVGTELRRHGGPRYRPDTADPKDREVLTVVSGLTDSDQVALYDRGIIRVDMLAPEADQGPNVKAGMLGFFKFDWQEEPRRRKAIRNFREDVAQLGIEGALEKYASGLDVRESLKAIGRGEVTSADVKNAIHHLTDAKPEALAEYVDELREAYNKLFGNPGARKHAALAKKILEKLRE